MNATRHVPTKWSSLLRRLATRLALAVFAIGAAATARADVICVPSDATLDSAVAQANNGAEGSSWEIHIHTGTYQLAANLVFDPAGNKDNKTFIMSGGWTGANNHCDNPSANLDPSTTIVRGIATSDSGSGTSFQFLGDNQRVEISTIRFENFAQFEIDDKLCYAWEICPDTDAVIVDHDEFVNGEIVTIIINDAKRLVFRNNLVAKMHVVSYTYPDLYSTPVSFDIHNNEDPPQISFNTFADLSCTATSGGIEIDTHNPNTAVHHNILHAPGCAHDLVITTDFGGQPVTPYYNLYLSMGGSYAGNLFDNGNVQNLDPQFVDGFGGNYRLAITSPAVNAGQTLLDALLAGFAVPFLDLDGHIRPTGTRYDIGAYESAVNDGAPPVLTVTNISDDINDSGSLRHAIDQANKQVGTAQRIKFNIPGACPQIILLGDPLPDITDALAIDGYSQPGANPTSDDFDIGSDANVCIVLAPTGGGISHALEVPAGEPDSTRLSVSGLAFGSGFAAFTDAAIELRAGNGHKITGNVFGGLMPSTGSSVGNVPRAVLLTGTATEATVGGPQNADRNTIGNSLYNAIVITGATSGDVIENNYIGITPNGLSAQPNSADGISATGGSDISIINNTIGASGAGIYISGASTTGFTIQRNRIGINAAGFGNANQANDVGIQIGGGSGQHVIGDPPLENRQVGTFSNDIRNNNTAGIYLPATAGSYISVRGNRIEGNGRNGTGLGIDVGTIGVLPNDAGDADSGPDFSQNYPIIKGSSPNGDTRLVKAVLNTNANQALRIDFYRSPTCSQGPTGPNATTFVGSYDVNAGPTGIVNFTAQVAAVGGPTYLTATATTGVGNTSELAPCFSEDTIYKDGHEAPGL